MTQNHPNAMVPMPGQVISVILQMSTFGVLCVCFTRRSLWIKNWRTLPLAIWLVLIIYIDSTLFVFATSIIVHGLGINSSPTICEGGILLCLICYMTTKILIYYFLVERAYIVRGSRKPRLKTKLWLFNCLFMILPYTVFVIMNFVWRITYINEQGVCIIGMQKIAMLPLITFEVVVNVYLTLLFILPIRRLYSYKHNANPKLNRMALRSLVGSLATLTTSVANLTVLMLLRGEPGWICLMCCNADILFCVLVLHWMTSKDKISTYSSSHASRNAKTNASERTPTQGNTCNRQSIMPEKNSSRNINEEIVELGLERQQTNPSAWPYENSHTSTTTSNRFGTITTEIHSSTPPLVPSKCRSGRTLQKSRDHETPDSECGDEVELHRIHVRSDICVDGGSSESESYRGIRNSSMDDEWGMKRSTSAEKIV